MVDALHTQQVEGFPDIIRRPFFARMGDDAKALVARSLEDAGEFARRMADLR